MGGIVGKVTDTIGLTDFKGAKKAAGAAGDLAGMAIKLGKEQIQLMKEGLQFQKDQLTDWKTIYGDVEKNLSDYYKNLNANDLTTLGLQKQQAEFQAAVTQIRQEAAQRGISNSGAEFAATTAANLANASERAKIRTAAPSQVAAEKANFLTLGLGQKAGIVNNINQAYGNVGTAYSNQIGTYMGQFNSYLGTANQKNSESRGTLGDFVGLGASFFF